MKITGLKEFRSCRSLTDQNFPSELVILQEVQAHMELRSRSLSAAGVFRELSESSSAFEGHSHSSLEIMELPSHKNRQPSEVKEVNLERLRITAHGRFLRYFSEQSSSLRLSFKSCQRSFILNVASPLGFKTASAQPGWSCGTSSAFGRRHQAGFQRRFDTGRCRQMDLPIRPGTGLCTGYPCFHRHPVGMDLQVASFDVGVIFLLTIGSFSVYGLAFGGWASNNKYSLLGGLRASAQMISYEVALGLSVIAILMTAETVDLNSMIRQQWAAGTLGLLQWNIFQQPLAAGIFLVAAFAETNRLPFDLAECEAELVGGFHTEYTGLKFAMFFMGEYVAMITMSALMVTMFLGGWSLPWVEIPTTPGVGDIALSIGIFMSKLIVLLFFYIWVRWTLPDSVMTS